MVTDVYLITLVLLSETFMSEQFVFLTLKPKLYTVSYTVDH